MFLPHKDRPTLLSKEGRIGMTAEEAEHTIGSHYIGLDGAEIVTCKDGCRSHVFRFGLQ